MTALKQLSAIYLAAASAFAATIVLADHPMLAAAARTTASVTARAAGEAAIALDHHLLKPGWAKIAEAGAEAYGYVTARPKPVRLAKAPSVRKPPVRTAEVAKARPHPVTPVPKLRPQILAPAVRTSVTAAAAPPPVNASVPPRTKVTIDVAPAKPAPPQPTFASPGPATDQLETARIRQRLKDNLTRALYANFDLFLYVSKAASGPVAQHMFVFAKEGGGKLKLRYDWPVSTGREKVEYNKAGARLPSFTPAGYYELDPKRMYVRYRSMQWGTRMPHAMFFNWVHDGYQTGLAIHAAQGDDIALLGQRASGGCIHLAPKNARALFDLIRADYRGEVPRFAVDRRTDTMSNRGELMRTSSGKLRYFKGYKVLIFIENYGGGGDEVATIM